MLPDSDWAFRLGGQGSLSDEMTAELEFNEGYRESVKLRDGSRVRLRRVRPEDKELIKAAWDRLSPESRYRRFFTSKSRLSEAELRYLTEVDGVRHFALGAVRPSTKGEVGLAVARFICLPEDRETAEAAIVVADDTHGKGLGRLLLTRLVAAARERGVKRFVCEVQSDNSAMRGLLDSLAPNATHRTQGPTVRVEFPLEDVEAPRPHLINKNAPMYRLLALAAEGALKVTRSMAQLGDRWKHSGK